MEQLDGRKNNMKVLVTGGAGYIGPSSGRPDRARRSPSPDT